MALIALFGPPLSSSRCLLLGQLRKGRLGGQPFGRSRSGSGTDPRPEPPLAGVSAQSGNDRCRIMRLSFRDPPLPGPRFCPESALRHAP